MPSGPLEEPAGKERNCLLTCSSLTCKGAERGGDVKLGRSDGGSGCFDRSSSSVSRSTFADLSLEHRILTAALMFPSSNLDGLSLFLLFFIINCFIILFIILFFYH